jgi:hypothetical protein
MPRFFTPALCCLLAGASLAHADPPVAAYIFPAGGQRGKAIDVRVGGLFLHQRCAFEMLGPGIDADKELRSVKTTWFEGPIIPLPDSQQAEDYPKDMAGRISIAGDAPLGVRYWRIATSQGATFAMRFMVGDLPEIVEKEIEGDRPPVEVQLPVTINGRIFPREDVDGWTFRAKKGQQITAEVCAARLGSPLDSRIEVIDPHGRRAAENDDYFGTDSYLGFAAAEDGLYQVRIHDANFRGGQAYVYRLTLTADPWVERIYPLGGRRGSRTKFTLTGQGVPADPVEITLPVDSVDGFFHRFTVNGKLTNPVWIDLNDLPEYGETHRSQPVESPAVLNGRIKMPGDTDTWNLALKKSKPVHLEVRAGSLGSPLTPVLSICDSGGKVSADRDGAALGGDAVLSFTPPTDGIYKVRVTDRFHSRGGPEFAYRLRVTAPPAPDFRLNLVPDAVTVNRGGEGKMRVTLTRIGEFNSPVELSFEGLPAGVSVSDGHYKGPWNAVEIAFKADAKAAIRTSHVTIRGTAKVDGRTLTHVAVAPPAPGVPDLDSLLLAVALPTPFKVVGVYDMRWAARGTVLKRRYKLERGGFDGPIEVSLADRQMRHLQGITGPTITVPAGVNEFEYPVTLPPWMETGRTARACVMAVGVIKDADGSEHRVSFHSVQQNEQVVAVVEPGKLSLTTEPTSLPAAPGARVAVTVRVARTKGLHGDVKLDLAIPPHIRGVSAEPATIAADKDAGTLTIVFAEKMHGPFTMPLVIRGTLMENGSPVIAEAKVQAAVPR